MELIAQLLDDLDDLVYAIRLMRERSQKLAFKLLACGLAAAAVAAGVKLALLHPPIALATALLLFVTLMYRAVTSPRLEMI